MFISFTSNIQTIVKYGGFTHEDNKSKTDHTTECDELNTKYNLHGTGNSLLSRLISKIMIHLQVRKKFKTTVKLGIKYFYMVSISPHRKQRHGFSTFYENEF